MPQTAQYPLLQALARGVPLLTVQSAVDHIDPGEWRRYFAVTRELSTPPDGVEWFRIKDHLDAWQAILPRHDGQKRYLSLVRRFPDAEQMRFMQVDALRTIVKTLPTPQLMTRLAKQSTGEQLLTVFQAIVDYDRALRDGTLPSLATLVTLFQALLTLKIPFYQRPAEPIPEQALAHFFEDGRPGVVIAQHPAAGLASTTKLVWHFVIAMMDELSDADYDVVQGQILLRPYGIAPDASGCEQRFPVPKLLQEERGLRIGNWSRDDLMRFYQSTAFDASLYKTPEERRVVPAVYIQRREQRQQQRRLQNTLSADQPGLPLQESAPILSPGLLQGLLKNHVPLNRHGWYAADHYKTRLAPTLLDLLEAQVTHAAPDEVPQTLRDFLANRQQPMLDPDVDRILAQWNEEPSAQAAAPQTLEAILTDALQRDILNPADLEVLVRFREQLTLEQTVAIVRRIPVLAPPSVVSQWRQLQQEKLDQVWATDPPLLSCDEAVVNALLAEAENWPDGF